MRNGNPKRSIQKIHPPARLLEREDAERMSQAIPHLRCPPAKAELPCPIGIGFGDLLESNPEGVFFYDGNWVAEKKVNGKSQRKHFSLKKHGEAARQLAIDARAQMVEVAKHEIKCQHCGDNFVWSPPTGRGPVPKFCSLACRVGNFTKSFKEEIGKGYRSRNYQPAPPPYERPEIPYERETEIPLLTNLRQAVALDAPAPGRDESNYQFVSSGSMSPDEILMMKEEMETQEYAERQQRIRQYERFESRRASAFAL